ncbi:MAG: chemotaxis protein CheC [Peptococcaceae bacterium]|jgi:chemotaxis protein CheC|nr:chemotaxis protein CheC [Peptococcaceae bacterium]
MDVAMLSERRLDALREIGNIGSGHAASALSDLLQRRIDMSVPKVWMIPFEQIAEVAGGLEESQAFIYLHVDGEISGKAVFLFSIPSAHALVKELFHTDQELDLFDELPQSALKEVGNILVSSFLVALSQLSGIEMQCSIPVMAVDMAGAVLGAILLEEGEIEDHVLFIDTELFGFPAIEGKFVFLPQQGALEKLLGALGV